ncbi:hypothetical protein GTY53_32475 [Streptomyces sp. SID7805]|nr:hypothetical protein [Streptomyces sp. SID7805]
MEQQWQPPVASREAVEAVEAVEGVEVTTSGDGGVLSPELETLPEAEDLP